MRGMVFKLMVFGFVNLHNVEIDCMLCVSAVRGGIDLLGSFLGR